MNDLGIFLNLETDLDNINSNSEELGKIPRFYTQETLRLIKSLRSFKVLEEIEINLILFKDITKYDQKTIQKLRDLNVRFLIPKLTHNHEKNIKSFYSGFWFIPLAGVLMENTYKKNYNNSHLLNEDGSKAKVKKYQLKLDADMVLINPEFIENYFSYVKLLDKPLVAYYDKDSGSDCRERMKYGIDRMSNTCLILSDLTKRIYFKWYEYLLTNDIYHDDLFEEVAFDCTLPYSKAIPLVNFQVGENYLCYNNLTKDELKHIYFYHGKLREDERFEDKLELAARILFMIKH